MTLTGKQKDLLIMYWLPKIHKTVIGCHFLVASTQCSTKAPIEIFVKCSNLYILM